MYLQIHEGIRMTLVFILLYIVPSAFILSAALYVLMMIRREQWNGPEVKGTFHYWLLTRVIIEGDKEIWLKDRLSGNVQMFVDEDDDNNTTTTDDRVERVVTFRHYSLTDVLRLLSFSIIPFNNVICAVSILARLVTQTFERADGVLLVKYSSSTHQDGCGCYHSRNKKSNNDDDITNYYW